MLIRKTAYAVQVIHVCWPYVFWPEMMPFNRNICCIPRADITLSWQLNEAYLGMEMVGYETINCGVPTTC